MPDTLDVHFIHPLPLQELLARATLRLKQLLRSDKDPVLGLWIPVGLKWTEMPPMIPQGRWGLYVHIEDVENSMIEAHVYWPGPPGQDFALFFGELRTPASKVLVAALAIAASELLGVEIEDEERQWADRERISAADLSRQLTVQEPGLGELFRCGFEDVLALVRENMKTANPDREFAFHLARLLPDEQRQKLLPDLVQLACEPSYIPTIEQARRTILTLPRRWTIEHVEAAAKALLPSSDDWVYRRLLELFALLDRELTLKFARHAAEHENPEIREAGMGFLNVPIPS